MDGYLLFALEQRLSKKELGEYTTNGPDIN